MWAINAITSFLMREMRGEIRHTEDQREKGYVMTEVETGIMWPQAEECQQPPEAGRGKGQILASGGEYGPANT